MMPKFHEAWGKDLIDSTMGPIKRYSTPGGTSVAARAVEQRTHELRLR